MDITEVRITLREEDKLKAFASITFDNCFVVRGLKVISGSQGYFVSMPSRRRSDGTYQDLAHPINNEMRKRIEDAVLGMFQQELSASGANVNVRAVPSERSVNGSEFHPSEETSDISSS